MGRKGKISILLLVVVCLLYGCKKTPVQSNLTNTPVPTLLPTAVPTQVSTIAPPENQEVGIYSLNSDTLAKEAVTVLTPSTYVLTPASIVDLVVEAMEDESFYIGIDKVTTEGNRIYVSFLADAAPVCNVGSSVESEILDAIGQSLLDNLPEYSKVIYRVEGEAYKSGHFSFGKDEVYIGR